MRNRAIAVFATAVLICLDPAANAGLANYFQEFELLEQSSLTALGDKGWVVYANVFAAADTGYLYGYGTFPTPNDISSPSFSMIDILRGGTIRVFSNWCASVTTTTVIMPTGISSRAICSGK